MLALSRRLCSGAVRLPVTTSMAMSTDSKLLKEPSKLDASLKYQVFVFLSMGLSYFWKVLLSYLSLPLLISLSFPFSLSPVWFCPQIVKL